MGRATTVNLSCVHEISPYRNGADDSGEVPALIGSIHPDLECQSIAPLPVLVKASLLWAFLPNPE